MKIYPAIDLYGGKAVRLFKGDYRQMTVYNDDPVAVARDFMDSGAEYIHLVDLEGAKAGTIPNFETVCAIKKETGLFCEIGGGIRSMDTVRRYLDSGIDRVILGTAAVEDPAFLEEALAAYGEKIAVGIDIKDGFVAIKGWLEKSSWDAMDFCREMESKGVKTLICTDISKDEKQEAMKVNFGYYGQFAMWRDRSMEDIQALAKLNIHGAIIGKAYYTGQLDLAQAIEVAK